MGRGHRQPLSGADTDEESAAPGWPSISPEVDHESAAQQLAQGGREVHGRCRGIVLALNGSAGSGWCRGHARNNSPDRRALSRARDPDRLAACGCLARRRARRRSGSSGAASRRQESEYSVTADAITYRIVRATGTAPDFGSRDIPISNAGPHTVACSLSGGVLSFGDGTSPFQSRNEPEAGHVSRACQATEPTDRNRSWRGPR